MTEDRVVTIDEIRKLIRAEQIRPDQLFDPEALKEIRDAARAAGYAEAMARIRDEKPADNKPADDKSKYLNPATNPFIKIS